MPLRPALPPLAHVLALGLALVVSPANAAPSGSAAGGVAPSPGAGAGAGAPAAASAPVDPEVIRKGIVGVEQKGRPLGLGFVLGGDGRVLTALSGLGTAREVELRYADGSTLKAVVGHVDKGWDLALLVPGSGRWKDGLRASTKVPENTELRLAGTAKGKLTAVLVALKGRVDATGPAGEPLAGLLDLEAKPGPLPGAPVLDGEGHVAAVMVRACRKAAGDGPGAPPPTGPGAPRGGCVPVAYGAPISAVRTFLSTTPATAVTPAPWLGIAGTPEDTGLVRGVRVMAVAPGSPSEKAGLKNGEIIGAVDGDNVTSPEGLAERIARKAVGETVKLTVFRDGKLRDVAVTLRAAP